MCENMRLAYDNMRLTWDYMRLACDMRLAWDHMRLARDSMTLACDNIWLVCKICDLHVILWELRVIIWDLHVIFWDLPEITLYIITGAVAGTCRRCLFEEPNMWQVWAKTYILLRRQKHLINIENNTNLYNIFYTQIVQADTFKNGVDYKLLLLTISRSSMLKKKLVFS